MKANTHHKKDCKGYDNYDKITSADFKALRKVIEKRRNKMANPFKNHKGLGDTVEAVTQRLV